MFELGDISFGDNVRIGRSDATIASGHADLVGVCYGMTKPSATAVVVVGGSPADVALNVHFEDDAVEDAWFSRDLVLLLGHAEGSRAVVGDQEFVKERDGSWSPVQTAADQPQPKHRWFRRR